MSEATNTCKCLVFNAGGSSMSGIALLLQTKGWLVHGYDRCPNHRTERLTKAGIVMHYGESFTFAEQSFAFAVHSSVEDSADLRERFAISSITPIYTQFALIDELTRTFKSIAITGSYGKTITTSLVVHILDAAGMTPSFTCGGNIIQYGTNASIGTSDYWVVEAVETHANLLHLHPTFSVILNIEDKHLVPLFEEFALRTKTTCIINVDDPLGSVLFGSLRSRTTLLSIGLDNTSADYGARDVTTNGDTISFTLFRGGTCLGPVQGSSIATFNIYNLLAASAIAHLVGAPYSAITSSIRSYRGVSNRFDLKLNVPSITVVTDIAHHPTSIRASIELANRLFGGPVTVVYRPHMYCELNENAQATEQSLDLADKVILRDVLSFKDQRNGGLDSLQFVTVRRNRKWVYSELDLLSTLSTGTLAHGVVILMGMYQDEALTDRICALVSKTKQIL